MRKLLATLLAAGLVFVLQASAEARDNPDASSVSNPEYLSINSELDPEPDCVFGNWCTTRNQSFSIFGTGTVDYDGSFFKWNGAAHNYFMRTFVRTDNTTRPDNCNIVIVQYRVYANGPDRVYDFGFAQSTAGDHWEKSRWSQPHIDGFWNPCL